MYYNESVPITSVRLPAELTNQLDQLAQECETTRSELIREAVARFCEEARSRGHTDRVALLDQLVTYPGSGRGDLGARGEEYLREIFGARRRSRSR